MNKFFNCTFISIIVLTTVLLCTSFSFAAPAITEQADITVVINGEKANFSDVAISVNDRTLLPLRALLVGLGVQNDDKHIIWNAAESSVVFYKDDTKVYLKVGSNVAYINDKAVTLEAAPVLYSKSGRTYIPVRFVAQALGYKVAWDAYLKNVHITSPEKYERVKSIIENSLKAMSKIDKYIMTFKIGNGNGTSTNATIKTDKKNKQLYRKFDNYLNSVLYTTEEYCLNDIVYSKSSNADWTVKKFDRDFDEYAKAWNYQNSMKFDDVLYSALNIDEKSSNTEFILSGCILPIFEGSDSSYVNEYAQTRISVNKSDYTVNKIQMAAIGKKVDIEGRVEFALQTEFSGLNSDFSIILPSELSSNFYKGYIQYFLGKYEEAIKYFDLEISQNSNNARAYSFKADALALLGKMNQALECYNQAIRLSPKDPQLYFEKGKFLFQAMHKNEEAIESFDLAIKYDPNSAQAYYGKGMALDEMGRSGEAREYYEKAYNIDPTYLVPEY